MIKLIMNNNVEKVKRTQVLTKPNIHNKHLKISIGSPLFFQKVLLFYNNIE